MTTAPVYLLGDINIDIVSTSEISISCLILRKDLNKAVQAIHDEFFPQDEK